MVRRVSGTRARPLVSLLVAAGTVACLLLVLVYSAPGGRSLDDRTHALAARLKCPACVGESTADSTSPVAQSIRTEIRRQLAAGRSEEQVVAWFRTRYGDAILLEPQRRGLGWILWAAPGALAVSALALLIWAVGRRRSGPAVEASGGEPPPAASSEALPRGALVGVVAVALAAAVGVPLVLTDDKGASAPAADTAAASTPGRSPAQSDADAVTVAFQMLRGGRPAEAERMIAPVARTEKGSDRALALLVLGLAQRAQRKPGAHTTLQTFLNRFPDHPAAKQVSRLLSEPNK